MKDDIILKTITKLLVPFIQLFAFYTIAHGETGPGGGFQGGVILGSSIILYAIVFGTKDAEKIISPRIICSIKSGGILLYVTIGLICMLAGGFYLEYSKMLHNHPELSNHLGIYGIEIGIGLTVCGVMATIFLETANKKND